MSHDRFRELPAGASFDTVVIGAGLGGLTSAALLARAGQRVLVLDQHYVAGGNATVFKRKGYTFDVGVHYLGDCEPDGVIPTVLRDAGVEVRFRPMSADGFDTLVFPDGMRFGYPRGVDRFEDSLLRAFPGEARGIRRWCSFLRQVHRLNATQGQPRELLKAAPACAFALRHLRSTLARVLDACTSNARLRAVLCGPHLDHAVAPSRVAAVLHAGVVMHYLWRGAFYPEGGGQVISDKLVEAIEARGGKVLLLSRVTQILVERGRAAGVTFWNKHLGQRSVRARAVISNADLKKTYASLLPASAVSPKKLKKVARYEMAPGAQILYLGVRESVFEGAQANTNYWLFPGDDVEAEYAAVRAGRFAEAPCVYVTLSSLKDPGHPVAPPGVMNLQLMAIAPSSPAAWGLAEAEDLAHYSRSTAYRQVKAAQRELLLARAEKVFPGLEANLVYQEMATPLTHARYTEATNGTPYGLACTPEQFHFNRPPPRTEIEGLVLAGASTRSAHGVLGAILSGREAAKAVRQLR